ncbi:MAG: peroxiredoxin family protein [Actinomycetota bacterium]|nr:peroxiredoxin family protein [Actinomycetota bacterium]
MAGLSIGQKVSYFELPDQLDYPWSISGQLETGPVVLVFYRGDWDPYCNGQLASYARNYEEFERRGAQVAGISVDPPRNNARMVGKLLLPFPLLSDPEGEIARRCGLWDAEEGAAVPSVIVVDQSGEVRYLYTGGDLADRPGDDEVFAALRGLDQGIERITDGPEFRVTAARARQTSVRPDRPAMEFEQLISYYRGALVTTITLKKRFGGWGRSGRKALREVDGYQAMVRRYAEALQETAEFKRQQG